MKQCHDLNEVRENIDRIDRQIVEMIARRSGYVIQAAQFKKDIDAVKAPKRVEAVIEKVRLLADEFNIDADVVESVYRNMINSFTKMELAEHEKATGSLK